MLRFRPVLAAALLFLMANGPAACADIIVLNNGRRIQVDSEVEKVPAGWRAPNGIVYRHNQVREIIREDDAVNLARAAERHLARGETEAAVARAREAWDKTESDATRALLVRCLLRHGHGRLGDGDWEGARALAEEILALEPGSARAEDLRRRAVPPPPPPPMSEDLAAVRREHNRAIALTRLYRAQLIHQPGEAAATRDRAESLFENCRRDLELLQADREKRWQQVREQGAAGDRPDRAALEERLRAENQAAEAYLEIFLQRVLTDLRAGRLYDPPAARERMDWAKRIVDRLGRSRPGPGAGFVRLESGLRIRVQPHIQGTMKMLWYWADRQPAPALDRANEAIAAVPEGPAEAETRRALLTAKAEILADFLAADESYPAQLLTAGADAGKWLDGTCPPDEREALRLLLDSFRARALVALGRRAEAGSAQRRELLRRALLLSERMQAAEPSIYVYLWARQAMREALELVPEERYPPAALARLAASRHGEGEYADAARLCGLALAWTGEYYEQPGDDPTGWEDQPREIYLRAFFNRAVACFERARQLAPDPANAYENNLLQAADYYQEAVTAFGEYRDRFGTLDPPYARLARRHLAPARLELGLVCEELGRPDQARIQYREIDRESPPYLRAQHNLGRLCWREYERLPALPAAAAARVAALAQAAEHYQAARAARDDPGVPADERQALVAPILLGLADACLAWWDLEPNEILRPAILDRARAARDSYYREFDGRDDRLRPMMIRELAILLRADDLPAVLEAGRQLIGRFGQLFPEATDDRDRLAVILLAALCRYRDRQTAADPGWPSSEAAAPIQRLIAEAGLSLTPNTGLPSASDWRPIMRTANLLFEGQQYAIALGYFEQLRETFEESYRTDPRQLAQLAEMWDKLGRCYVHQIVYESRLEYAPSLEEVYTLLAEYRRPHSEEPPHRTLTEGLELARTLVQQAAAAASPAPAPDPPRFPRALLWATAAALLLLLAAAVNRRRTSPPAR